MRISVKWIKELAGIDYRVAEIVDRIGSQLGAIEEVINFGERYKGLLVVKVIKVEKHSDADKLNVCLIDDGKKAQKIKRNPDGLIQVVCGAPNVQDGMFAVWIPPGSIVPSTFDKDPFEISTRKIRGVESNGMLASASELGISDDHSGIVELTADDFESEVKEGVLFADVANLDDTIIDLENKMFTHRPDCFGVLGVAREIAGIFNRKFKSPDWYISDPIFNKSSGLKLSGDVDSKTGVSRFMIVAFDQVEIKPSPLWIQIRLQKCGIKPINNVVDITNYTMYLTGQPLHAYDYDRVKSFSGGDPELNVRFGKEERIKLLNGKEISFDSDSVVIATDKKAIGLGGIMGGSETEVNQSTKRIILEAATFDLYNIRRTSMKFGLFTEAVVRFSKGQSNLQNDRAIKFAMKLVSEMCGGQQASNVIDITQDKSSKEKVGLSVDFINSRLGSNLSEAVVLKHLQNVEFDVRSDREISVKPPFWRQDIEIAEDVVEEIGRLNGYHNLNVSLPTRDAKATKQNPEHIFNQKLRDLLSRAGANELLTYSFVHGKIIQGANQNPDKAFRLSNAISPDLQYYRMSILPSLLVQVRPNNKAGFDKFAFFEIGKTHQKTKLNKEKLPNELESLAFVFACSDKKSKNLQGSAYYQSKAYLAWLSRKLGINFCYQKISDSNASDLSLMFDSSKSAEIVEENSSKVLGVVGEFHKNVVKNFKLPNYCSGFELDICLLRKHSEGKIPFKIISKYPSTQQDICFRSKPNLKVYDLETQIKKHLDTESDEHGYDISLELIDIYQGKDMKKHITYRVRLSHQDRTLITAEVNKLLDRLSVTIKNKLSADRI